MKIALSMQNGRDLSGHAGRCTRFALFTIENKEILSKEMIAFGEEATFHSIFHNNSLPFSEHPLHDVDVIISTSMGPGFVQKMRMHGIDALQTSVKETEAVIENYLNGSLILSEVKAHHH